MCESRTKTSQMAKSWHIVCNFHENENSSFYPMVFFLSYLRDFVCLLNLKIINQILLLLSFMCRNKIKSRSPDITHRYILFSNISNICLKIRFSDDLDELYGFRILKAFPFDLPRASFVYPVADTK